MPSQVLELVVYQIKAASVDSYINLHLPKFKQLVSSFAGMLSYETQRSCSEDGQFIDLVTWTDLSSALKAAKMVKAMQQGEEFEGYLAAFEKVIVFHHYTRLPEA